MCSATYARNTVHPESGNTDREFWPPPEPGLGVLKYPQTSLSVIITDAAFLLLTGGIEGAHKSGMKKKIQPHSNTIPTAHDCFTKRKEGQLLKPASGWYSLWLLLQTYRAKVLATAIEHHGLLVLDRFDRPVSTSDKPDLPDASISHALNLLAAIASEERDPGPTSSLNDERWEIDNHPLERFGWTRTDLPDFEKIANAGHGKLSVPVPWSQRTAQEFQEEVQRLGGFTAAANAHNVSRQRYTRAHNKAVGKPKKRTGSKSAPGVHEWLSLGARNK